MTTAATVRANGLSFGVLEAGSGPLALCLHGFPDSAHTWRYLLPMLAESGFHAFAPFMRGYAPTQVPDDGSFGLDALSADVSALHDALSGDGGAVLIGHDWGAEAAYVAAAVAPERLRSRAVEIDRRLDDRAVAGRLRHSLVTRFARSGAAVSKILAWATS